MPGFGEQRFGALEVDAATFSRVAPLIPEGVVRVAESGVSGPEDVEKLAAQGADVVLVGEALVTGGDPERAVAAMVAAGKGGSR